MPGTKDLVKGLSAIVGREFVQSEPGLLSQYRVDHLKPSVVVFPADTGQVSKVVQFARAENLAVVPWGSGTKMAMGKPPERVGLVLCTSRMNRMTDVDTANLTITVEAGVKLRDIQARLATQEDRCYLPLKDLKTPGEEAVCSERSHSGCFLPLDPPHARAATMGGIIATNSSGPRRLLYRAPRDLILGVRMVTPSGAITGSGGKTVKNVSGYDISKLAVGSLGTLGVLCEMTFKLLPLPESMETLIISFGSLSGLSAFAHRLFETSLLPAAVEVMNPGACVHLGAGEIMDTVHDHYLSAVALEDFEPAVERMRTEILQMAKEAGALGETTLRGEEHGSFWLALSELHAHLAKKFSGLIQAKLTYPISQWRGVLQLLEETFSALNLDYTFQARAGNGVCLTHLLLDAEDAAATDRAAEALDRLLVSTYDRGGNLLIQRAPTEIKGRLQVWGQLGSHFPLMERIKKEIDPERMMSPGRFVGGL